MLTNKILGIIGAIFIFLATIFHLLSMFLSLFVIIMIPFYMAGIILLIIAIRSIATITKDETVFISYLKFGIPWIIALFIPYIILFFATPDEFDLSYYSIFILLNVIAASLFVYSAEYLYKCFKSISQHYKTVLFVLVGYMYLTGTILILVFYLILVFPAVIGVVPIRIEIDLTLTLILPILGAIFLLVGSILQLVAFMIIPENSRC